MPSGRHKSGTLRKVQIRTPGGRTVQRYDQRNPKAPSCATCKKTLPGIPRERPIRMANLPKTQKRPERPYGGVLCSTCTRQKIKLEMR